jgi:Response receiver domain
VNGYEELQRDAAKRFLQTGLIVDDRISTDSPLEEDYAPPPTSITAPQGPLSSSDKEAPNAKGGEIVDGDGSLAADELETLASKINVKHLADHFVDLVGLTCGVLKPEGENHGTVTDRIVRAASGVDIIVLDWMLEPNDDFTAEDAVVRIVSDGSYGPRVLAIYTTHRKLADISDALRAAIGDAKDVEGDDLALDAGGTRIVIYHKGGPTLADSDKKYLCPESELPTRVVDVFIAQTRGLVPAVALNAVAATRENTHRLLRRLHGDLDLGYLGHALRLPDRSDAGQHLLDAISGEFRTVIEDDDRTVATSTEGFRLWLDAHADQLQVSAEGLIAFAAAHAGSKEDRKQWRDEYNDGKGAGSADKLTTLLVEAREEASAAALQSDARFAQLLALRRPYSRASPGLHLGTIVRELDDISSYWLCIQPVCDAVRLPGDAPTNFLMLPLQPVDDGLKTAFVVDADDSIDGDLVRLWLWRDSSDLELMRMLPTEDGAVRFASTGGSSGPRTVMTEDGVGLVWAGQLKPAHALRVAHEFGHHLSRVGLDESEWLRAVSKNASPEQVARVPMVERVQHGGHAK